MHRTPIAYYTSFLHETGYPPRPTPSGISIDGTNPAPQVCQNCGAYQVANHSDTPCIVCIYDDAVNSPTYHHRQRKLVHQLHFHKLWHEPLHQVSTTTTHSATNHLSSSKVMAQLSQSAHARTARREPLLDSLRTILHHHAVRTQQAIHSAALDPQSRNSL